MLTVYDEVTNVCVPKLPHCDHHSDCQHHQMCCRNSCCPKYFFDQWKQFRYFSKRYILNVFSCCFSCVIDEQCQEWKTGQKCCSGGKCCDKHDVEFEADDKVMRDAAVNVSDHVIMEEHFLEAVSQGL